MGFSTFCRKHRTLQQGALLQGLLLALLLLSAGCGAGTPEPGTPGPLLAATTAPPPTAAGPDPGPHAVLHTPRLSPTREAGPSPAARTPQAGSGPAGEGRSPSPARPEGGSATPGAAPGSAGPEFYLSPEGSDSRGDGSRQKPWQSFTHALRRIPDGAALLALPGLYEEELILERRFDRGVTLRSLVPYAARLRFPGRVITCDTCAGFTIEGFDIAHLPQADKRYLIQIQDEAGDGQGGRRIILRNNIIHDSYHNDLLKVNNGAGQITIEGNLFYNMGGPAIDNHIDVNSASEIDIQDNIFFNCYECSGRDANRRAGHFIVIKDSNGERDGLAGSRLIRVRRNIFLNWQGIPGGSFIGLGDGQDFDYYQAQDILIENNLMLGNSGQKIHAALKIDGGKNVLLRNNTISGDLPSRSFALRLDKSGSGLPNVNIQVFNNIWSDPTGTMGVEASEQKLRFSDTPAGVIASFTLAGNLYWNGGEPVPFEDEHPINYTQDGAPILADPRLPADLSQLILPYLDEETAALADGSASIREAFRRLALGYGTPGEGSPALDAADPGQAPAEDLLGRPRPYGAGPDIGALEAAP